MKSISCNLSWSPTCRWNWKRNWNRMYGITVSSWRYCWSAFKKDTGNGGKQKIMLDAIWSLMALVALIRSLNYVFKGAEITLSHLPVSSDPQVSLLFYQNRLLWTYFCYTCWGIWIGMFVTRKRMRWPTRGH